MQPDTFDVVIVGSGASGGTLAAHLARRGVRVALVEGGPRVNTRTDFNTHALPFDFPNRQIPTMRPGKAGFDSERSRGVGGKTMLWNAVALRFSQRDFKGTHLRRRRRGLADRLQGHRAVLRRDRARSRRLRQPRRPRRPARRRVPAAGPAQVQRRDPAARAAASLGATGHSRSQGDAHRCRPRRASPVISAATAWPAATSSRSTTRPTSTSPPPKKTGQVTVFPDCIVREVLMSDENRATGVRYLHRVHQQEGEVRGRTVVVACACVQSVALLLMSTSARYPTGLANSSGQLGRHFIPHFTGGIECVLEGPARQGGDQRRGVSRSRATCRRSCTRNKTRGYARSFGAQLNYQNSRFAGWAKTMSAASARPTRRR